MILPLNFSWPSNFGMSGNWWWPLQSRTPSNVSNFSLPSLKIPDCKFMISKPTYRRSWRSTCQLSCNPGLVRCSSPCDGIWCTSKDRSAWRTFWSTWDLSIDIKNLAPSSDVPVHLCVVHVVRHGVFWGEIRIGRHFLRRVDDRGLHHGWFWKFTILLRS